MDRPAVISLCDKTGNMVRPWAEAGFECICVDIQHSIRKDRREGFTGTNPFPSVCERVLRGGAFNYPAAGLRVTNRVHHPGRYRLVMSGFRCAH